MIKIREHLNRSTDRTRVDFNKIITGVNVSNEAVLELDRFKKSSYKSTFVDEETITKALEEQNVKFLRGLSEYYDGISGMYSRICKYLSGVPGYDWYAFPYLLNDNYNKKSIGKEINKVITYLDNLNIKYSFYDISLKVIVSGVYYGYLINAKDGSYGTILELPIDYCRSRYKFKGSDTVEFNVKYFDEQFRDQIQREIVLKSFPKEFLKAYNDYKEGKILVSEGGAWFLLDLNLAMRFSFTDKEIPIFAPVIPAIIKLEQAKEIDMKKSVQELLKIVIQKLPLDKNYEMVFDMEEARDLHNNACQMLSSAVNVDVLTTFADVEVESLDSADGTSNKDPLAKIERNVFNEAGISPMLFATDGNLSLEKSITSDETLMFYLLGQYQIRLNLIVDFLFNNRNTYKFSFLRVSNYNRDKVQKMFSDLATKGYSKLLPVIASGVTQSEFISLNTFENDILDLNNKLVPVQLSSTQTGSSSSTDKKVGAPEKDETEVSEKTILNKESQA